MTETERTHDEECEEHLHSELRRLRDLTRRQEAVLYRLQSWLWGIQPDLVWGRTSTKHKNEAEGFRRDIERILKK